MLSYSPSDGILPFELGDGPCEVKLSVKNTSGKRVMFKVKTTQPMWYFVKPNFDVLDIGQEMDIKVVLIDEEKLRYMALHRQGQEESVMKHRFMLQYATLTDAAGAEVMELKENHDGDKSTAPDFTSYWMGEGKDKGSLATEKESSKFKVSYTYLESAHGAQQQQQDMDTSGMSYQTTVPPSSRYTEHSMPRAAARKIPENPQEMRSELVKLRDDYDKLLDTFMNINGEKEKLEQSKELKKDELRAVQSSGGGYGTSMLGLNEDRPVFSIVFFLVSCLLAFFLGQYLSL